MKKGELVFTLDVMGKVSTSDLVDYTSVSKPTTLETLCYPEDYELVELECRTGRGTESIVAPRKV